MKIKVHESRELELIEKQGTQNENDVELLELEVPEKYENWNKKIVFVPTDNDPVWDLFVDNKYSFRNNITHYDKIDFYIWLTHEDKDFRSMTRTLFLNENVDASNEITPEEQGAVNTILQELDEALEETNILKEEVNNLDVDADGEILTITKKDGATKEVNIKGEKGDTGDTGATPNIQIGDVTSGNQPEVIRRGTDENPIFDFVLEKGEKGDKGDPGEVSQAQLDEVKNNVEQNSYNIDLINSNLVALNKNYEMGSMNSDGTERENTDGTRWRTPSNQSYSSANIEYIDIPTNYYIWVFYYINDAFSSRKGPYTNQHLVPIKPSAGANIRLVVAKGSGYKGVLTLDEIKRKIKVITKSDLENRVEVLEGKTTTLEGNVTDLDSRVETLEQTSEELPNYWKTYLNNKYQTFNNFDANLSNNFDSFVFITDMHIDDNYKKSPKLIKAIIENSSTDKVICGGDILTSYLTKQEAINKLAEWRNMFDIPDTVIMNLIGNHDLNHEGNSENTEAYTTTKNFVGILLKKYENIIKNSINHGWTDGCYYDNEAQKIRYLFLYSGGSAASVIGDSQINYMKARINELASGWSVIVFTHMFFSPSTTSTINVNGNGNKIMAGLDEIYDTCDATIIGVIAGHIHRDYNITSEKGYPIITTTCDANGTHASTYDTNFPIRTQGTTTEQAFDVFHIDKDNRKIYATRIGAGIDREFSY